MKIVQSVIAMGTLSVVASVAMAAEGGGRLEAQVPVTPSFVADVLLFILWTIVAAIVIGAPAKRAMEHWGSGDLWARKTSQVFADDAGAGHGTGHGGGGHH
jgi:hypothetical protein